MMSRRTYPFNVITRVLAERLRGRAASEELQALVRSGRVDWERTIGHASAQFVLPALAAAMKDLALSEPETELGAFLEAVHAANLERNSAFCAELATALGILNAAGIEPALVKGAIRLADGLYPDHGWRVLRDLDLLVPTAAIMDALRAFQEAGYVSCQSDKELWREGGACQIDVHRELSFSPRQIRLLQGAEVLDGARVVEFAGGRLRIPSIEHQLVHLVAHGQIRHLGHALGRISLRDRLEMAALVHWGKQTINWDAIIARFAACGYQRPLLSSLLSLKDGNWCAVPLTDKPDLLTTLQQRRIALQDRSPAFAYFGSRVGWWVSTVGSQFRLDEGERKGIKNLKTLFFERGAIRKMTQAFLDRGGHLVHGLAPLSWFLTP
jgi:Uncharacterised nucleotidyltransferase